MFVHFKKTMLNIADNARAQWSGVKGISLQAIQCVCVCVYNAPAYLRIPSLQWSHTFFAFHCWQKAGKNLKTKRLHRPGSQSPRCWRRSGTRSRSGWRCNVSLGSTEGWRVPLWWCRQIPPWTEAEWRKGANCCHLPHVFHHQDGSGDWLTHSGRV